METEFRPESMVIAETVQALKVAAAIEEAK